MTSPEQVRSMSETTKKNKALGCGELFSYVLHERLDLPVFSLFLFVPKMLPFAVIRHNE